MLLKFNKHVIVLQYCYFRLKASIFFSSAMVLLSVDKMQYCLNIFAALCWKPTIFFATIKWFWLKLTKMQHFPYMYSVLDWNQKQRCCLFCSTKMWYCFKNKKSQSKNYLFFNCSYVPFFVNEKDLKINNVSCVKTLLRFLLNLTKRLQCPDIISAFGWRTPIFSDSAMILLNLTSILHNQQKNPITNKKSLHCIKKHKVYRFANDVWVSES